jgi:hypothetical protein
METKITKKSPAALLICEAIIHKNRIRFIYHEKDRIGEPQSCGISTAGKEVARVHMVIGGSRPEQLFELTNMESLEVLNEHFSKPGPNYRPNDSAMMETYCQL